MKQDSSFNIVNTLSILIIMSYMVLMPLWVFYPPIGVPEGVLAIINQMMGAWGMAFGTVIAFHLGSSKGAKEAAQATRDTVNTLSSTVASTAATAATTANTAATIAAGTGSGIANGVVEAQAWNDAVTANTVDAFNAYLAKFPSGVHMVEAKARLAALQNP